MRLNKFKTHELEKCYSIAPLNYKGEECILVAAEKVDRCMLFSAKGEYIETVWTSPGGTMSMVQVPNGNGQFLATHKFYSPNDSKEAKIVVVTPKENGSWDIKTLVDLPHVHRFDIIERNGVNYLIAAALCSGRDFKDDWSYKGKVYACKLPTDLSSYNEDNQLEMKVIKDELLKNHGYFRGSENGYNYSVIGSENGVYKFTPPENENGDFDVTELLNTPASDMTLTDLDGDGNLEMLVFSAFHGANVDMYKIVSDKAVHIKSLDTEFKFSHAIWSGKILGKNMMLIGNREGDRKLMGIYFENGEYKTEVYDENVGPANVFSYVHADKTYVVSANRETNEIAWYEVEA